MLTNNKRNNSILGGIIIDRLPNTKSRDKKNVEESLKKWLEWEWESKVRRFQQLGLKENWNIDRTLTYWLEESEYSYVLGNYFAAGFFAGASLEIGMKIFNQRRTTPIKFKSFNDLINKFHSENIFDKAEKDMAHELRKVRNFYGHGEIDKLANKAVKDGVKVKVAPFIISSKGSGEVLGAKQEIIEIPTSHEDKLTFLHFNSERTAWKSLKYVNTLFLKLFPPEEGD